MPRGASKARSEEGFHDERAYQDIKRILPVAVVNFNLSYRDEDDDIVQTPRNNNAGVSSLAHPLESCRVISFLRTRRR